MKKLQNNFTTQEQSKRLLELGVPSDSADCCLHKPLKMIVYMNGCTYIEYVEKDGYRKKRCIPCWSAARLMEIYLICKTFGEGLHFSTADDWDDNMLDNLCNLFDTMVKYNYIDFSKLED